MCCVYISIGTFLAVFRFVSFLLYAACTLSIHAQYLLKFYTSFCVHKIQCCRLLLLIASRLHWTFCVYAIRFASGIFLFFYSLNQLAIFFSNGTAYKIYKIWGSCRDLCAAYGNGRVESFDFQLLIRNVSYSIFRWSEKECLFPSSLLYSESHAILLFILCLLLVFLFFWLEMQSFGWASSRVVSMIFSRQCMRIHSTHSRVYII